MNKSIDQSVDFSGSGATQPHLAVVQRQRGTDPPVIENKKSAGACGGQRQPKRVHGQAVYATVADIQVPMVHSAGTSPQILLGRLAEARVAVVQAISRLIDCRPADCDFIPQGQASLALAQREHRQRLKCLDGVVDEVEFLTSGIRDQIDRTAMSAFRRLAVDMPREPDEVYGRDLGGEG